MLDGSDATITINMDGVFINNAQVIVTNLMADNGVVHVINAVITQSTSVNAIKAQDDFTIFPNPATSFINFSGIDRNTPFQVFNLTGEVVMAGSTSGNTLSVEPLSSGVYLLQVNEQGNIQTKRFVVQ